MTKTLIALLFVSSVSFGQDEYRMQFGVSAHSTMFGGTRSFENVSRSGPQNITYYDKEVYSINYANFNFSAGLNFKFSFNWLNRGKGILRQSVSGFADFYEEKISYTLTDYEIVDTNYFPATWYNHDFQIGDENLARMNGLGFGLVNDLIYLRELKSNWKIGGGIAFNIMRRHDWSYKWSYDQYGPNDTRLYYGQYTTKQLGLVFHLEKSFERWNIFLNLNQAFLTTKKEELKGGEYYPEVDRMHPISHNLDYRFPLLINFGTAVQFRKLKR